MTSTTASPVTHRKAVREDIPFLARLEYEASLPPLNASLWDDLLEPTGTPTLTFLEAMFKVDASNWGRVEDFIILEVEGRPAAGCAVYQPGGTPNDQYPLNLARLDEVAAELGWSEATTQIFRKAGQDALGSENAENAFLTPQADLIVESVAVLSEFRGQGLGRQLIETALGEAKRRGANSLGIMVIHGNDQAQRLYEHYFEPYATFHTAFFDGKFPGLTKYKVSFS